MRRSRTNHLIWGFTVCFQEFHKHEFSPLSLRTENKKFEHYLSCVMRKTDICICENKDADQLPGNREADQRLCFRYTDSTIHLLHKFEISSLWPSSVTVQPGLCRTWSETPKTGFLTRLILLQLHRKLIELINAFFKAWMLVYVVLHGPGNL